MKRAYWSTWFCLFVSSIGNPLWIARGHDDLSRAELAFDYFLHGLGLGMAACCFTLGFFLLRFKQLTSDFQSMVEEEERKAHLIAMRKMN